jgi:HAD superfamily hydrolase (TIGR01459 family)
MSAAEQPLDASGPIERCENIAPLAARFDGFLIDIWGVIHDGRRPFPGVLDALARLRAAGRRSVLLSNSSRPAAQLQVMLDQMGVGPDLYDSIVSSGEACKVALERMQHPTLTGKARRCLYIGDAYDHEWLAPLGVEIVTDPDAAEFLLLTSIEEFTQPIDAYLPTLLSALDRKLPLLCANPDRKVLIAGTLRMGSGTLADLYEDLEGTVLWFGKPHAAVYDLACERLRALGATTICAIGDALETDVLGAHRMDIPAALVPAGGVHRAELALQFGGLPGDAEMAAAIGRHGVAPQFLLAALR